jgi:RNase P/RNase MRP subunit POP5
VVRAALSILSPIRCLRRIGIEIVAHGFSGVLRRMRKKLAKKQKKGGTNGKLFVPGGQ